MLKVLLVGTILWFCRSALAIEPMVHVDIRDLAAKPDSQKVSLASEVLNAMINYPQEFFPAGVRVLRDGPGFKESSRANSVYGIELDRPLKVNGNKAKFYLRAMYHSDDQGYRVRWLKLKMKTSNYEITTIEVVEDMPLNKLMFSISVDLEDLKMVVEDKYRGVVKVYPIGAGGWDEGIDNPGITSLLTPEFRRATLRNDEHWFLIPERWKPSYFSGRPFIRVSNSNGDSTPFGFHYKITKVLKRGYVSHGCMRMRDKDLYELFALVKSNEQTHTPLEVLDESSLDWQHPYERYSGYSRVKNLNGEGRRPRSGRGKDGLLIMEWVWGQPRPIP